MEPKMPPELAEKSVSGISKTKERHPYNKNGIPISELPHLLKARKSSVFLANPVGSAVRCGGEMPLAAYSFNLLDNR